MAFPHKSLGPQLLVYPPTCSTLLDLPCYQPSSSHVFIPEEAYEEAIVMAYDGKQCYYATAPMHPSRIGAPDLATMFSAFRVAAGQAKGVSVVRMQAEANATDQQ